MTTTTNMTSSVNESAAPITSSRDSPVCRWPQANNPSCPPRARAIPPGFPSGPPLPAPGSTLHSLNRAIMFGSDSPAEQQPGGGGGAGSASSASEGDRHQQQTPVPFSGGRKPTLRSVCIVSMQIGRRRHGAAKTSAIGGLSPTTLFSSSRTPDARLRAAIATPPKFQTPGLARRTPARSVFQKRAYISTCNPSSFSNLAHVPLQTFLDFNAAYILIEVAKFPNLDSPGVPRSGHNWVLGAVAYIACWTLWIFGVFLGYEVLLSIVVGAFHRLGSLTGV